MKVRIGTRGSDLALWQANHVAGRLREAGAEVELEVLVTRGDRIDDVPLQNIEGKAFFTKEIEDALLEGRVDVAVHSHKDLPVESPPGLVIAAVPERASPAERLLVRADVYVESGLFLPLERGAIVGTSSPRRQAQLAALRPDFELAHLRGNVPTRVQRLRERRYDAILLAAAGLDRLELDLTGLVPVDLDPELFVPAPGQGALAIQIREDDADVAALVGSALHREGVQAVVDAERGLLGLAGGGCNLALGAVISARPEAEQGAQERWSATIFRGADAGDPRREPRWMQASAETPIEAARAAYHALQESQVPGCGPLNALSVAITGASTVTALGRRLASLGARVSHEVVLGCEDVPAPEIEGALASLTLGDALVVTSRRAVPALTGREIPAGVTIAAVGPVSAAALEAAGVRVDLVGKGGARELARVLPVDAGAQVLHPSAVDPLGDLEEVLGPREVRVVRVPVYRTHVLESVELAPERDVRVYLSPSAVRATLAWESRRGASDADPTLRIAIGRSTFEALEAAGLEALCPRDGDAEDIVRLLVEHLEHRGETR